MMLIISPMVTHANSIELVLVVSNEVYYCSIDAQVPVTSRSIRHTIALSHVYTTIWCVPLINNSNIDFVSRCEN